MKRAMIRLAGKIGHMINNCEEHTAVSGFVVRQSFFIKIGRPLSAHFSTKCLPGHDLPVHANIGSFEN